MENMEVNRMEKMTEGMGTHIVGAELPEDLVLVPQYGAETIAISDLYERRILASTGLKHEVVIDCRDISPAHLSWGWDHLFLGPIPGLEAVVYDGFNYGKLEPILKYNHFNINAIEKTAEGFRFKAFADMVYCSTGRS